VEWSKQLTDVMLDIYVDKCKHGPYFDGWTEKRIRNELVRGMDTKQEYYMTAAEALDKGFCDGVIPDYCTLADILNNQIVVEKV
jgi:ATP-dependent protease ClpP protease subunit